MEELLIPGVIEWLQKRQPDFTHQLAEFGEKSDQGFDWRRKPPYLGQFTGAGLCAVASGVEEYCLKRRFPGLEVESYFLHTRFRDLETHTDPIDKPFPHHFVRFRIPDGNWYIADPTFRQLDIYIDPSQMLNGIPFYEIEGIYHPQEIYQTAQAENPENADKYKPRSVKPGYIHAQLQMLIGCKDYFGKIKPKDYQRLIESLST